VAAFANDETEALIGARVVPRQWLLSHWTAPSVDRENDIAVVEASDGVLCGYLSVQANPPYASVFSLGMVALPYHGRGLGAALVAENERRAQRFFKLADTSLRLVMQAGALADEPLVSNLLAGRGYREVRRHELRRIDFVGEPEPPAAPLGIEVRTMRPSDSEQVFAAHREAFADHWGEDEETYEDFHHRLLGAPEFDAKLWFLAWEGDELAGYIGAEARAAESPQRGYVPLLGVRRAYRRRGVGETLLRHVFRALFLRGKRGCDLHVDTQSLTGATRLYERLGMEAHPRFALWEKEIRPEREAGLSAPSERS
jgi:mycothiol synthase